MSRMRFGDVGRSGLGVWRPSGLARGLALVLATGLTTGLAIGLAGCGGSGGQKADDGNVNAGLTALASGKDGPLPMAKGGTMTRSEIEALAAKSAVDLEGVLKKPAQTDGQNANQAATQAEGASSSASLTALGESKPGANGAGSVPTDDELKKAQEAKAGERTLADGTVVPAGAKVKKADVGASPDERIAKLSDELAALLRERAASSKSPFGDALALTGIEAIRPGVLKDLDTKASPFAANLAESDKKSLDALRGVMTELSKPNMPSDPAVVERSLRSAADRLAGQQVVKVSRAALCSRVNGYGQIDPIASNTFIAGRSARAILYIELDDFANRQDSGKAGQTTWTVELSRELGLYANGMLAWHRKPTSVRETSLNRRRDFYLIEEVEFPATLGVGKYDLKITVRDVAAGGTQAEYTLPIQIVADGSVR